MTGGKHNSHEPLRGPLIRIKAMRVRAATLPALRSCVDRRERHGKSVDRHRHHSRRGRGSLAAGGETGFGPAAGDTMVERGCVHIYIPVMTSAIISVVLSLLLWLFNR